MQPPIFQVALLGPLPWRAHVQIHERTQIGSRPPGLVSNLPHSRCPQVARLVRSGTCCITQTIRNCCSDILQRAGRPVRHRLRRSAPRISDKRRILMESPSRPGFSGYPGPKNMSGRRWDGTALLRGGEGSGGDRVAATSSREGTIRNPTVDQVSPALKPGYGRVPSTQLAHRCPGRGCPAVGSALALSFGTWAGADCRWVRAGYDRTEHPGPVGRSPAQTWRAGCRRSALRCCPRRPCASARPPSGTCRHGRRRTGPTEASSRRASCRCRNVEFVDSARGRECRCRRGSVGSLPVSCRRGR